MVGIIPTSILANTIVLTQGLYSFGDGGEFTAVTSGNGTFNTFCVEPSVYFTPGQIYSYNLASVDSQGNNLREGTALLFSEFSKGNLSGYDYTGVSRQADAGLLQSAIWGIQYDSPVSNNPYYLYAYSILGTNVFTANNNLYDTSIIQIWDGNNQPIQNQLYSPSSVPESCNTFVLLIISIVGLMIGSRPRAGGTPSAKILGTPSV